jgi:hypothetical protein
MKRGWIDVLHVAALGVWLGAVVMAGYAAARIFPMVKALDPRLADYGGYAGDHWLLLAGKVANSVLAGADVVQVVAAFVAVVTLVVATTGRTPTASLVARWATVLLVMGCLAYNLMVLRPRMSRNAEAYWSSALHGDNEGARTFQAAFTADHPAATRTMAGTACCLLLCIGAMSWWMQERKNG